MFFQRKGIKGVILLSAPMLMFGVVKGQDVFHQTGSLPYHLTTPEYRLQSLDNGLTRITAQNASYPAQPGHPRLPVFTYIFALPPGTKPVKVDIQASRIPVPGQFLVEHTPPALPMLDDGKVIDGILSRFRDTRRRVYSGEIGLSRDLGRFTHFERREYSLVTVNLSPFYFNPVKKELSVATDFTVVIDFEPVGSERAEFIQRFMDKGTLDAEVPGFIHNKTQARDWYKPHQRLLAAPRMLILTTEALQTSVADYVTWRQSSGFEVSVVTVEDVVSSDTGPNTPAIIRAWLRENAANYDYLFIIGNNGAIPMQTLTSYNNGDDPFNDPLYSPHFSDIYYSDLSRPDSQSWDSDDDGLYGETYDYYGTGGEMDQPDMEGELAVGRINSFSAVDVEGILNRIRQFEEAAADYKKNSVLTGGPYHYWTPTDMMDGADFTEYLLDSELLEKSFSTTLYEKEGSGISLHECDIPVTRDNLVSTLSATDAGIFVEAFHGWHDGFSRKVWYDDGDNVAEDNEYSWLAGLNNPDVPLLNTEKFNTAYLLSCLCAKPEVSNNFALELLKNTSVGVVAYTRVCWGSDDHVWQGPGTNSGSYELFWDDLRLFTGEDYTLGEAVKEALAHCGREGTDWERMNAYGHVLSGDPALKHLGWQSTGVTEPVKPINPISLTVDLDNSVRFSLPEPAHVNLAVWDVTGRRMEVLVDGTVDAGKHKVNWGSGDLPAGTYFITLRSSKQWITAKTVVIR